MKYAKIIDNNTKQVQIFSDNISVEYAISLGLEKMDVELGFNGLWYEKGFTPIEPEKTYTEKRMSEYPSIEEQLDMIYWDNVNKTNNWQNSISEIKSKYPKK